MKPKMGLVIPCYNEEDRLDFKKVYDQLKANNFFCKILFVDDGSLDNTVALLEKYCLDKNYKKHFSYLPLKFNVGKGEAVRAGMNKLYEDGFDLIGFLDADLAAPISSFNDMLEVFKNYKNIKCIIGSRIKMCGKDIKRYPWRHYVGRLFVTLVNSTLGTSEIYDTQCGAKLFKREILDQVLCEPFESPWLFDIELLLRIRKICGKDFSNWLYELSLRQWHEISGSKVTLLSFFGTLHDVYKIGMKYR